MPPAVLRLVGEETTRSLVIGSVHGHDRVLRDDRSRAGEPLQVIDLPSQGINGSARCPLGEHNCLCGGVAVPKHQLKVPGPIATLAEADSPVGAYFCRAINSSGHINLQSVGLLPLTYQYRASPTKVNTD